MKTPRKTKKRLDVVLVERGLFPTRTKAQAAIMAGKVLLQNQPLPKPGMVVDADASIEIVADACPYVSRGGIKLAAALDAFSVNPAGRTVLDVGASTGGFTDCVLQRGAGRVYAVDVGRGQLDFKLRNDPRIVVLEELHARDMEPSRFDPPPDLAVIDVSFISLTKVLEPTIRCLKAGSEIIALVKPQFELEAKKTPHGIVRKPEYREEALTSVRAACAKLHLKESGCIESPITGAKGNVEYLIHLKPVEEPE